MQHFTALEGVSLRDAWVTVGTFDGVHLGHQQIISKITAGAHQAGLPAVIVTFYPHPALVLRKREDPFYLTTPDERAVLLGELGADVVITIPFTPEVAALSAYEFMARLKAHTGLSYLVVGYDFALGRGREGNAARLREIGVELGYILEESGPVLLDGEAVSSTAIRACLLRGDIARVNQMLARPYQLTGRVVRGDGRGRRIGIPTANLSVWAARAIPGAGVYACRTVVNGIGWGAVTNIGVRPTFEEQPVPPRVEAHLLDFDQDLYDQDLPLEFVARLRDEQRFSGVEALVAQIRMDIVKARLILDGVAR
jgi:riboflavin kinase/FMN adenylyltransferase